MKTIGLTVSSCANIDGVVIETDGGQLAGTFLGVNAMMLVRPILKTILQPKICVESMVYRALEIYGSNVVHFVHTVTKMQLLWT